MSYDQEHECEIDAKLEREAERLADEAEAAELWELAKIGDSVRVMWSWRRAWGESEELIGEVTHIELASSGPIGAPDIVDVKTREYGTLHCVPSELELVPK